MRRNLLEVSADSGVLELRAFTCFCQKVSHHVVHKLQLPYGIQRQPYVKRTALVYPEVTKNCMIVTRSESEKKVTDFSLDGVGKRES